MHPERKIYVIVVTTCGQSEISIDNNFLYQKMQTVVIPCAKDKKYAIVVTTCGQIEISSDKKFFYNQIFCEYQRISAYAKL